MKTDVKAFLMSTFLHLLAVGSAISFATFPLKSQTPILVDFTIEQEPGPDAETRQLSRASSPPRASHIRPNTLKRLPPAPAPPRETLTSSTRPVTEAAVISTALEAVPVAAIVPPGQADVTASCAGMATSLTGITGNGGLGTTSGSGEDITGRGNGPTGESAESLRARYLKEHFAYIRDLIAGNLRYPGMARRMGWSGKLAVEFVVRKSGAVDSIRVVKSSGIPLLDSDAEETVRRSAPFPKPPVSARLVIPVEYVLEN